MIYLVVFIFILIPVIKFDLLAKKGGEDFWFYSSLVFLILVAGLRYRVGGDTLVYMAEFDSYPKLNELKYFDFETAKFNPLWCVFNSLCCSVSDSFTFFQIIHAIILNCTFFHFFRKYCPRYYFSAILVWFVGYWFYLSMEILRESICICILLWSTDWLLEKKYVRYLLMCIAALLMHYSSIAMFILPFSLLVFRHPDWKLQIILLGIVVVATSVVNLPLAIANHFSINEKVDFIMEYYLENGERSINGILVDTAGYLPVLGLIWLRERNNIEDEFDFTPIVSCMFLFTGLSFYLGIAERFLYYFIPYFIVYLVNTIYEMQMENDWRNRNVSALVTFAVLFLVCSKFFIYYYRDRSDVYPNTRSYSLFIPYHSVLNPVIDNKRECYVENLRDFAIMF